MWYNGVVAIVAQLVEQLIRNEQVTGSIPANGSIFCSLILVVCSAGEMIRLFFGEVAGGEEEVVVDLDRGELREFLIKEVDGGDGGGADFDFVGRVFGEELSGVDESG